MFNITEIWIGTTNIYILISPIIVIQNRNYALLFI